jgi:hypothetical protein
MSPIVKRDKHVLAQAEPAARKPGTPRGLAESLAIRKI